VDLPASFLPFDQHRGVKEQPEKGNSENRPLPISRWMQQPKKEHAKSVNVEESLGASGSPREGGA
jgi:hypothetical protein